MKLQLLTASITGLLLIGCGGPKDDIEKFNRELLDESLKQGTAYLLNNQRPEGDFNYQYDFVKEEMDEDNNQVRQAGVLWGLSLIYQDSPTKKLRNAMIKGIGFYEKNSVVFDGDRRMAKYPGKKFGKTGTHALQTLALIDFLRADDTIDDREKYEKLLDENMKYLLSLRREDGLFHKYYDFETGEGYGDTTSPYVDGECLLAMIKAAKYHGYEELQPLIIASADAMYQKNVVEALKEDPDSDTTKGFYQWASMSFFEIATTNWPNVEKYGNYAIDLAYWMIDVHKTLERTRNTAYAYEGIISSYELAKRKGDQKSVRKFKNVIDIGLYKLTSWQVGGPNPNKFLRENPTKDPLAVGGVMNHRKEAPLRIDVAQHQMHAIILAKRYVYN